MAQYARIQALVLFDANPKKYCVESIKLLDMVLAQWPEKWQLESVHLQRGLCLEVMGKIPQAMEAYLESFEAHKVFPKLITNAYLDFGWLVARRRLSEWYPLAIEKLAEFREHEVFPLIIYRSHAIQAMILDHLGDRDRAREHAIHALAAAAARHSGFSRHPNVGLVESQDKRVERQLRKLASRQR
jgi:tetratricopeptide (TPR) repeat protein